MERVMADIQHTDYQKRFEDKFIINPINDCWEWTGCLDKYGYGHFSIKNYAMVASRASWILYKKQNIDKMCVLHKCDNRKCVNPDHLFLGTRTDNMKDKISKNRQTKGELNGDSKLTRKDVENIKKDKRVQSIIADLYGVSQPIISRIKNKRIWKHV